MMGRLRELREELGRAGLAALCLIAATAAFSLAANTPLAERRARLDDQLASKRESGGQGMPASAAPAARLDAFYRFFDRTQTRDEWLAKIYGIATASGIVLRAGSYQLAATQQRIDRYRMTFPVSGSYAQIRAFVAGVLAEMPIVSLDQVNFRRRSANDAQVEAEIVLTLHTLRK